ncbi:hypothetical protein ACIGO9_29825 [Nocardia asteroides]|uniref:hypothetical protein n=1 Tax=Nocardia asteroides TaxID=1824 RepID=UPI0037CA1BD2
MGDLAHLLRSCRDAFLRTSREHHWAPAEGSVAAADIAVFSGQAGIRDDRAVLETVCAYLELAVHNCAALAAVCEAGEVIAAPPQLARSVIENCARACWVIDNELVSDPTLNRLARTYIDHHTSAVDRKLAAQRFTGKDSPSYKGASQVFEAIRAEIRAVFPETVGANFNSPKTIHGQRNLNLTQTVVWFFDYLHRNGMTTIDGVVAEGLYVHLSNQTHPTISTMRDRRRFIAHGAHFGTQNVIPQAELEKLVRLAVGSVQNALVLVHRYCGWPFDPDGEFEGLIEQIAPGLKELDLPFGRPMMT